MYTEINSYCKEHGVTLLVVSKMRTNAEIRNIYDLGQREFAENRVQDLIQKKTELPVDIQWHLIGSLQRNKVKFIAPFITLIHSVDDFKLWQEIQRQALLNDRMIPCLLQIKISQDETKNGFVFEELTQVLQELDWRSLTHVPIQGVMGMASLTQNEFQVRNEFQTLKNHFDQLKHDFFDQDNFKTISMGMSSDYLIAIEEGSTMVRIGSKIFEQF